MKMSVGSLLSKTLIDEKVIVLDYYGMILSIVFIMKIWLIWY